MSYIQLSRAKSTDRPSMLPLAHTTMPQATPAPTAIPCRRERAVAYWTVTRKSGPGEMTASSQTPNRGSSASMTSTLTRFGTAEGPVVHASSFVDDDGHATEVGDTDRRCDARRRTGVGGTGRRYRRRGA